MSLGIKSQVSRIYNPVRNFPIQKKSVLIRLKSVVAILFIKRQPVILYSEEVKTTDKDRF